MQVRKLKSELTDEELTHIRIRDKLDSLEVLKVKVILGFGIFWLLWIIAAIVAWGYYIGF